MNPLNMNNVVGKMNVLFLTLDTLRLDVAQETFRQGRTPNFAEVMSAGWVPSHSPGSFTYASHHSFFAGFLPTPAIPGKHERLFAAKFQGSETTTGNTCVFDEPDIVSGFFNKGYETICIGGVGFFNKRTPLGCVLPGLFAKSYWNESFGVTDINSAENQFQFASELLQNIQDKKVFLFINISAMHQPNYFYLKGAKEDSVKSQAAALEYVDSKLAILFNALKNKGETFCIVCSDHGTAYGENGFYGHRIGDSSVWNVPFATFILQ